MYSIAILSSSDEQLTPKVARAGLVAAAPKAANPLAVHLPAYVNPPSITPAPIDAYFNSFSSYLGNITPSLLYSSNCGIF